MGLEGKKCNPTKDELPLIEVVLNVSMNCIACERKVAKIISKINGVEMFMTDMQNNRVVVKGRVIAATVVKKLRKKTRKKVEIIVCPPDNKSGNGENEYHNEGDGIVIINVNGESLGGLDLEGYCSSGTVLHNVQDICLLSVQGDGDGEVNRSGDLGYYHLFKSTDIILDMFSDENVHACCIM